MKTSSNGLNLIAAFEGVVLHVYKDVAGIETIGVGHRIRPGESFTTITHEQAMELLAKDVSVAEATINTVVKVPLTQNQFDALCSFTFNVGGGAFAHSTLLVMLNKRDYAGAAKQMLVWCKATVNGQLTVVSGLLRRRQAEMKLFLSLSPAAQTVLTVIHHEVS